MFYIVHGALQDGATHVSVTPIGVTVADWQQAGETSIWTQAIWGTITVHE